MKLKHFEIGKIEKNMSKNKIKTNKNINKKSQMEAFGLAIIVVLIIIGLFIFVSLRAKETTTDPRKEYIYDQMASNFVNSIAGVHVKECYENRFTISDLARSCALGENVQCQGIGACMLLNSTITKVLENTLVKQNFAFRFYTENLNMQGIGEIDINRNCTGNMNRGKRGWVDIRLYPVPGDISMNLDICKR